MAEKPAADELVGETVSLSAIPADTIAPAAADATPPQVDGTVTHDPAATTPREPAPASGMGQPTIPGYEVLDVLGRGGMGVVYKARHLKLNRLVALKMILAGEHVGPEQAQRFMAEARAVAKVQHPNIMQVYEIGEHKGLAYLALEFVAGGSLEQHWKRTRQDPAQLAAVVETLARAMHVAHQQGIVHRDLKPANILLAADGAPKIGDFGLAKQLDAELEQTRSGAVMGTPAYMAPEQAQGLSRSIGPATDVYALGVILYVGLTGHPPFHGDNVIATLQQVIGEEPPDPSSEVPGLPRDLETICLKCLNKEPAERYGSALDLAEDLLRFRQGEPIRARPVGLGERAWKWVRRRPARAALIGLTGVVTLLLLTVILLRGRTEQIQDESARIQEEAARIQDQSARVSKITALTAELETGLKPQAWTPSHLTEMDKLLAELENLESQLASQLRQRLNVSFADGIRASFSKSKRPVLRPEDARAVEEMLIWLEGRERKLADVVRQELSRSFADGIRDSFSTSNKPVLRTEDVAPIEEMLKWLEARDRRLTDTIREEMGQRLRLPQLAMDLQFPFDKAKVHFTAPMVDAGPQGLSLRSRAEPFEPVVLSEAACGRNAEMEAVFQHEHWNFSGPIGLILNAGGKDQGYSFLLRVAGFSTDEEEQPKEHAWTFAEALQRKGSVKLQIYRNQQRLRDATVPIAQLWPKGSFSEPIRLKAVRSESRLQLMCNNVHIEFEDASPLSGRQMGVFGLHLSKPDVRLLSLRAWIVNKAQKSSPLERGDELYSLGKFGDALVEFLQLQTSTDARVRLEAEYKAALCLLQDKEADKAIPLLTNVARDGSDERWNLLASCQLWALHMEQGKKQEADLIFQSLVIHKIDDLNLFLPDHLRDRILTNYRIYFQSSIVSLLERPGFLADYERASAIEEFFHTPVEQRHYARLHLFRAHGKARQYDKALDVARALFKEAPAPTPQNRWWWHTLWEEYALLMRVQKRTEQALKEVTRDLFVKPGIYRPDSQPLLIERANLLASLERWPEAERDLEEFFRLVKPGDYPARFWTRACLMRGFLRQRQGDKEGALAAWQLGLPKSHRSLGWALDRTSPLALIHTMILCSLCSDFPDSEVELMTTRLFNQLGGIVSGTGLKSTLQVFLPELAPKSTGPMLREMWRTEEGQRIAQQVAFRERPMSELYRIVGVFAFVQLGHRVMEPHRLTKEEDALLRHFADDMYTSGITAKLGKQQLTGITPLVLSWRNLPTFKPFDTAVRSLEEPLRGPLAYFFGLRYRHTYGNEKEAAAYFNRALRGLPPQSPLHQLAKQALAEKKP